MFQHSRLPVSTRSFNVLRCAAVPLVIGSMSGCLINSENHTSYAGNYVSPAVLSHVTIGQSPSQVEAYLGAPNAKITNDDGSSLWRWDYTESHNGEGDLFLLFHGEHSTTKPHATFVEFRDGAVSKVWTS